VAGNFFEHKMSAFLKRIFPDSWFFGVIGSHYKM